MGLHHKYIITYKYRISESPEEFRAEQAEYISAWVSNGKIPPETLITYTQKRIDDSVDIVEIVWEGLIHEGFSHSIPFDIPKDCILILTFHLGLIGERGDDEYYKNGENLTDTPLGRSRNSSVSIPSINNAIAVIGNVIPVELHENKNPLFLPKLEFMEYNMQEETKALFRRDIKIDIYKSLDERVRNYFLSLMIDPESFFMEYDFQMH
jgi:hypothetical protein